MSTLTQKKRLRESIKMEKKRYSKPRLQKSLLLRFHTPIFWPWSQFMSPHLSGTPMVNAMMLQNLEITPRSMTLKHTAMLPLEMNCLIYLKRPSELPLLFPIEMDSTWSKTWWLSISTRQFAKSSSSQMVLKETWRSCMMITLSLLKQLLLSNST